ncbi:MAG: glycosyltransferase family 2 protein [Clostridia bacterium]|nr:glycosyltransferase family 2 protein [Clostridia bacterium]
MKNVQVLMSTYNGEKYLKEQIDSILSQENVEVSLLIRDDGSTDKTISILEKTVKENTNVSYYIGKNIGSAKSFIDLVNQSKEVDYYAFADQDDVWNSKKIISAIEKIENDSNIPSLYISALEVVDEELNTIEIKKVSGNLCFEGEMAKNFATGCTMVFNKKLCNAIKTYNPSYIIMHDSWITRVCYAIGGNVVVDENTYIKYRQHGNNVVGYKDEGFRKLKKQLKIAFVDKISMRVNIAKELKSGYEELLTDNAKELVNNLISYQTNWKAKKWLLKNKKFRTNITRIDRKIKIGIILNRF